MDPISSSPSSSPPTIKTDPEIITNSPSTSNPPTSSSSSSSSSLSTSPSFSLLPASDGGVVYLGKLLVEREIVDSISDIPFCKSLLEAEIQRMREELGIHPKPTPMMDTKREITSPLFQSNLKEEGTENEAQTPEKKNAKRERDLEEVPGDVNFPLDNNTPNSPVTKTKKVVVPIDDYPGFNFVGRIMGPGGSTLKKLETESGCKVAVRGKGSIRSQEEEKRKRSKKGWEHLNEPLHVILTSTFSPVPSSFNSWYLSDREAEEALERGEQLLKALLIPPEEPNGMDEVKREQLKELHWMKEGKDDKDRGREREKGGGGRGGRGAREGGRDGGRERGGMRDMREDTRGGGREMRGGMNDMGRGRGGGGGRGGGNGGVDYGGDNMQWTGPSQHPADFNNYNNNNSNNFNSNYNNFNPNLNNNNYNNNNFPDHFGSYNNNFNNNLHNNLHNNPNNNPNNNPSNNMLRGGPWQQPPFPGGPQNGFNPNAHFNSPNPNFYNTPDKRQRNFY